MTHSPHSGSTLDELARIEAENELRVRQSELASRQQAADNAVQDAALAAARVAEESARLNPVAPALVVPAAPLIPAWQPTETMSGEAVRLKIAIFGRAILGHTSVASLYETFAVFERGELAALLTALEKGAGLKAAPRHNDECVEYREWLTFKSKPLNCVAGCPMIGYKPPTTGGTSASPTRSTTTTGNGSGHSAGKVPFVGPDGTRENDMACTDAARRAAAVYPTATKCIAAVANLDASGPQANVRLALVTDIALGNVPQGTFGPTIFATRPTPAGAAYPFTPVAAAATA